MPQTINILSTQNTTIPSDVYSLQITMWGAGGGGESVNTINAGSVAGGSGGNTSFLNLIASGGNGGQSQVGGSGGSYFDSGDWSTTYDVSVNGSDGNSGQVTSGGSGLNGIGGGGNGSPSEASFNVSMSHIFNNDSNTTTFSSTSQGITATIYNPGAADGLPCGTQSYLKGYGINFNVPYDNSSYTITMNSFCQQAAGGSTTGPFQYAGSSDKTANGFKVYFCRVGKNSYIRCFNLTVTGQRSAFKGAGGGSGGKLTTSTISRETLISAGYNPGQSYSAIVGTGGSSGTRAFNGSNGKITLYYIIQAKITLYADGNATETAILYGESVDLTWNTSGDVSDTYLENEAVPNNGGPVTVSPTVSTTYTAQATGLGGSDTDTVLVRVYQPPSLELSVSSEANYGENVTLEYEFEYANISVVITPQYKYRNANNDGFNTVTGDNVTINPISTSAEFGINGTLVSGSIDLTVPYNDDGPFSVTYFVTATGDGGAETKSITTNINIDLTPDNLNIPSVDAEPNEEPVYSPEPEDQQTVKIEVQDVDIPVEVKSDKPIKISLDNGNTWLNIREKA
jgi:hypothetical protein